MNSHLFIAIVAVGSLMLRADAFGPMPDTINLPTDLSYLMTKIDTISSELNHALSECSVFTRKLKDTVAALQTQVLELEKLRSEFSNAAKFQCSYVHRLELGTPKSWKEYAKESLFWLVVQIFGIISIFACCIKAWERFKRLYLPIIWKWWKKLESQVSFDADFDYMVDYFEQSQLLSEKLRGMQHCSERMKIHCEIPDMK